MQKWLDFEDFHYQIPGLTAAESQNAMCCRNQRDIILAQARSSGINLGRASSSSVGPARMPARLLLRKQMSTRLGQLGWPRAMQISVGHYQARFAGASWFASGN